VRGRSETAMQSPPFVARRKLTFKDKHALATLPATMKKLESELVKLEASLSDTTLFSRDQKLFETTTGRITQARIELSAVEEQWLGLELLREELEVQ
jgi:ABC transport system ATP-binding/permease protein